MCSFAPDRLGQLDWISRQAAREVKGTGNDPSMISSEEMALTQLFSAASLKAQIWQRSSWQSAAFRLAKSATRFEKPLMWRRDTLEVQTTVRKVCTLELDENSPRNIFAWAWTQGFESVKIHPRLDD
jgi:hypothetical protein